MYQLDVIDTPTIEGFEPSPINGKISGANLTIAIAITRNGVIFRPEDPVRVCAWLETASKHRPIFLSPTSGKKDDLLWTKKAADQKSLTIVFRITKKHLEEASLSYTSLEGGRLRIRADLPTSSSKKSPMVREIPSIQNASKVDIHATESSLGEEGSDPSILMTLLENVSLWTPLDVIGIGWPTLCIAYTLASLLSVKLWRAAMSEGRSLAHLEPSTIVVAEEAEEVLTAAGQDRRAELWVRQEIKSRYIDPMVTAIPKAPCFAVFLRFANLDSNGLGDGACDRVWSLIIAADGPPLNESMREAKANQIEAVATSSIWHSTDKVSPKLLLITRGPVPAKESSLLDMVESDGWEIVERFRQLPEQLFPTAAKTPDMRYYLLEYRRARRDYLEIVLGNFERKKSKEPEHSQICPDLRRTGGAMAGDTAMSETRLTTFSGPCVNEGMLWNSEAPHLLSGQRPLLQHAAMRRAGRIEGSGQLVMRGTPDTPGRCMSAAKRPGSPKERSNSEKKRSSTQRLPEDVNGSIFDASHDDNAADGTMENVLHPATDTAQFVDGQDYRS